MDCEAGAANIQSKTNAGTNLPDVGAPSSHRINAGASDRAGVCDSSERDAECPTALAEILKASRQSAHHCCSDRFFIVIGCGSSWNNAHAESRALGLQRATCRTSLRAL
jgi:hypothetical protein